MATLEHLMLNGLSWQEEAACRDLPVDWFFPEVGAEAWQHLRRAVAVCESCPVIDDCLKYALSFGYRALPGIWGGTSENQRHGMLHSDIPVR
jgi:WhiB family redox-sensing transcriptional regulator